jgi:hypothetical protein
MIEASRPGKVKVRREPSLRSSWRWQGVRVCADEESTGSAATAGSLKKAGWGKVATCARADDFDLRFGTLGRVGRRGRGFFFGAVALGVGRLVGGLFFNLDGSTFRTR